MLFILKSFTYVPGYLQNPKQNLSCKFQVWFCFQNSEGERKKSFGEIITEDFQRRHASNVIELANINRDLNEHLRNIQEFTQQVCSTQYFYQKPPGLLFS